MCLACGAETNEAQIDWSRAVEQWYDAREPALLRCPRCGADSRIERWTFRPMWALGYLGFEFYEWFLKPEFVQQIASWLDHRVALVQCHL